MSEEENRELRNAIFAAKAAAEGGGAQRQRLPSEAVPGVPVMNAAEAARQKFGFDLVVHSVPLPSRGLVYPPEVLGGAEEIDIKAMSAREEDILMNQNFLNKGTVITELIKSCVMDKRIDVNSLISGDRNALMVAVRITGYTAEYTPQITCAGCQSKQDFVVDLQSLKIKELDLEHLQQVAPGQNAFNFTLPTIKKVVTFKFLTGQDEERILQDIQAKKKRGITAESPVTTKLMNSILAVDGNTDRNFINQFCQLIPAMDSLAFRKEIDENEPTIDMKTEFNCPNCGYQEVLGIPIGASFFWPNAPR
jgi:hypothetical protein